MDTIDKKISITIPTRNSQKTLSECLDSVLTQDYKNYEIILVDNNSTDKTREIIKHYAFKNDKIKYFFEPKIGRGQVRNSSILHSTGDIIVMLDSDCLVAKNWLRELIRPIMEKNEVAVMGNEYDLINNYWTKNIQKSNLLFLQKNAFGSYIKTLDTKNFAITSEVIKKIMFDENLKSLEDFDLYLRLSPKYKIKFLPQNKVGHRHKNSWADLVVLNINRGYWSMIIYKKYKKNLDVLDHPMFETISIVNLAKLPFWLAWQLIKNPQSFPYTLTCELSWRLGILGGLLR